MEIYDITIIGAGPVGMFAAFYAGMRQAKTKIIDSLPQLGGQLATLYPEKYIYDIPGYPAIKASELIDQYFYVQQLPQSNHPKNPKDYYLQTTIYPNLFRPLFLIIPGTNF